MNETKIRLCAVFYWCFFFVSTTFFAACKTDDGKNEYPEQGGSTNTEIKYNIIVKGAALNLSTLSAKEGDVVSITITGEDAVEETLVVEKTDGASREVAISGGAGSYTFTMPAQDVIVRVIDASTALGHGGQLSFIASADSLSGWDEIHTFYYEAQESYGGVLDDAKAKYKFQNSAEILDAQILIVAGGGGGGYGINDSGADGGGGGGAGDIIYLSGKSFPAGSEIDVEIGAGGEVGTPSLQGANGSNSSWDLDIAYGGGGGGSGLGGIMNGNVGGSSGGGAGGPTTTYGTSPAPSGAGNKGGNGSGLGSGGYDCGGGGGGAGGFGTDGSRNQGLGGAGLSYDISGGLVTYSSGGNGGAYGIDNRVTANRSYGDGGDGQASNAGQPGHSGIVIVRFPWKETN